ncbi:S1 RNA-binding domain-containing protein [Candidatus Peregrinibacteria bacterium]|nr:S1 RNA-binding domain-containing protein [Candidatus Peregrinibacteria bacterium]
MSQLKANVSQKDTAKIMEELLKKGPQFVLPLAGQMIQGTVISIHKDKILVDLGGVITGIVTGKEARDRTNTQKSLKIGDVIDTFIIEEENPEGLVMLSLRKASQERTWKEFHEAFGSQKIIEVKANEANKGGLLLEIDGIKGFIPVSQLAPLHYPRVNGADAHRILERLQKLIGTLFKVKIINIDKENGKLILSERAALEEERKGALAKLKVGQKIKGKTSGIVKFGIFVAFDGLEGLVHISEIAWGHVNDPNDYGKLGDQVEVLVIGIEGEKISLSMKRLVQDPWIEAAKTFKIGKIVESEITRVTDFGAFIKLNDEINGLIHLTEITDDPKVTTAGQVLKVGEKVKAKIIGVDLDEHRIGLSIKALKEPKDEKTKEETKEVSEDMAVKELKGISGKISESLEKAGYKTVSDLKKAKKEDLIALDGIGEKTVEKILSLI